MWMRPEKPLPIHPSQTRIGLFIWLDLGWKDHPFFYNKFRITTQSEVDQIQALGVDRIYYFPNKSIATPGPKDDSSPVGSTASTGKTSTAPTPDSSTLAPSGSVAETKDELRQKQKDIAARADRGWERAAKQVREALLGLGRNPRLAGENLADISRDTAKKVSSGDEVLLHLLGDKNGEGPQFHALNVMTLSVIVGKALALSESELADLAMGSLAHDCGLNEVPQHIVKAKTRQRHEEEFYRSHCNHGVKFARESAAFTAAASAIIQDHHEFADGSGYPGGKTKISLLAGIVALVNRYDELCSPDSPQLRAMMPAEALAYIYAKEKNRYDAKLLGVLIRILGIYPPGTLVQLNDGSLGLVVSPGKDSLRPKVLVYDPDVAKDEAPVLDLSLFPGLQIEESLSPDTLPGDVIAWLNPRQRLSYFFSAESTSN